MPAWRVAAGVVMFLPLGAMLLAVMLGAAADMGWVTLPVAPADRELEPLTKPSWLCCTALALPALSAILADGARRMAKPRDNTRRVG